MVVMAPLSLGPFGDQLHSGANPPGKPDHTSLDFFEGGLMIAAVLPHRLDQVGNGVQLSRDLGRGHRTFSLVYPYQL